MCVASAIFLYWHKHCRYVTKVAVWGHKLPFWGQNAVHETITFLRAIFQVCTAIFSTFKGKLGCPSNKLWHYSRKTGELNSKHFLHDKSRQINLLKKPMGSNTNMRRRVNRQKRPNRDFKFGWLPSNKSKLRSILTKAN